MKIKRTENAIRNIIFGVILKVYQLIVPFILRTVIIYKLGIEYVGLSSLFTSILSVLSLAELGVGAAMVYSMYRPIAEGDTDSICALMKLYKIYYRIIGAVILLVSIALLPFLPNLISGEVPETVNIYVIYSISVTTTVLSYWLFAYKGCLFSAHQRGDITSKISLIISTLTYAFQLIALFVWESYYLYLFCGVVTQIIQNLIIAKTANRVYPAYQAKGTVPATLRKNINKRVRDLFTAKVGGVVYNSVDTIVISACLGITVLGIYNNYYYIMTSVIAFLDILIYACLAGIGNSIVTETKEKNFIDFKRITFIMLSLSTFCVACFFNLYQPFMQIWMQNNTEMLLNDGVVVCLCIQFFLGQINKVVNLYKDAAGIWHVDRFRPLVAAATNLFLNLLMVQYIGIFGIVLSTILATLIIDCPWVISKLFRYVFERKNMKRYVISLIRHCGVAICAVLISWVLCGFVNMGGGIELAIRVVICGGVSVGTVCLAYRNTDEFCHTKDLICTYLCRIVR